VNPLFGWEIAEQNERERLRDLARLKEAIGDAQELRMEALKRREEEAAAQQQFSAKVIGFEDGFVLVSVNQGGAIKGRSLSNGNFAVGDLVSYFLASGESVGFVDKMPSG
jgi:hypothetical protein